MRVLFLGSGAFGAPALVALAARHTLVGVVTQPDRPAGRSRRPTPTPIGQWAADHATGIPLIKPEDVNDAEIVETLGALHADAMVVIAFGQKLGEALLGDRFAVNLHASLLPRWRGAAPINHAILAGDAETGTSVITLAKRMDAGLVLGRSALTIEPESTAGELHDLLANQGPALIARVLDGHADGSLRGETQDEALVTHARKLAKADGWIDPSDSADACRRRIHGLNPWPGVSATLDGQPVKLRRAKSHVDSPNKTMAPGSLVDPSAGLIACGEGTLQLIEVQPPGKRPMPWRDYQSGHAHGEGTRLESDRP